MDVPQVNDRPVLQAFQAEREAQSGMFVPQEIEAQNQAAYAQDQNRAFASAAGLVKGIGEMWAQGQMEAAKVASYTASQKLNDQWMSDAASGKIQPSVADDGTVTVKPTDEWTAMRDNFLSQAKDKYQAPGAQSFLQSSILENANRVQTDGLRAVYDKYQKDYYANASLGLQMTTDALAKGNSFEPELDGQGRTVDYKKLDLSTETDIIRQKVMDIKGLDGPAQNILIQQQKNTVFAGMVDKEAQRLAAIDPAQAKSFIEAANDKYRPDDVTKLDDQALKQLLDKSSVIEQATKEKITNDAQTQIEKIQKGANSGWADAFTKIQDQNSKQYPGYKDEDDKIAVKFAQAAGATWLNVIGQDLTNKNEDALKEDMVNLKNDFAHDFNVNNAAFADQKKSIQAFADAQLGRDEEQDAKEQKARETAEAKGWYDIVDANSRNYEGLQNIRDKITHSSDPNLTSESKQALIKTIDEYSKEPSPDLAKNISFLKEQVAQGAIPQGALEKYLIRESGRATNFNNPVYMKQLSDGLDEWNKGLEGQFKANSEILKQAALDFVGVKDIKELKDPAKLAAYARCLDDLTKASIANFNASKTNDPEASQMIAIDTTAKMVSRGFSNPKNPEAPPMAGSEDAALAKFVQGEKAGSTTVDASGNESSLNSGELKNGIALSEKRIKTAIPGVEIIGNSLEKGDQYGLTNTGERIFKAQDGSQYKVSSDDGKTTTVMARYNQSETSGGKTTRVLGPWVKVTEKTQAQKDHAAATVIATATENQDINRILTKEQNDRKQTEYQANQEVASNVMSDPSKFDAAYKGWDGEGKVADYLMKWEKAH
jgi:hypothetical protein